MCVCNAGGLRWLSVLWLLVSQVIPHPLRTPPPPPLYSFLSSSGVKLRVSVRGTSDSAPTSSLSSHLSSLSLPFLLCSLSLSFSASAKHSTLSWSLAPGSLLSLLLSRSVAVWKERRVVAGKAGGRSQSRGRHSLSFFPPLLSFPVPSSHLQGVARKHSDFQILHLRLLDMIVTWFPSASFPSACYSATVSLYLLCFSTICVVSSASQGLIPSLISTSLALPLPLFFSSAHFRFSLSLCLSLSEVRHTALYICCVSFCAAYQISRKALI